MKIRDVYQREIIQNKHQKSEEFNNTLFCLLTGLSEDLFSISSILNSDLYQAKDQTKSNDKIKEKVQQLLNDCGLKNNKSMLISPCGTTN